MSNVEELNNNNFEDFTKQGLVLVDFFADWCMPCKVMSPVIDELSKNFEGKVKFGKVDIEDNQELAQKFGVQSIPNFILFKNNEVLEQFMGSRPKEDFEKKLNELI